MTIPFTELRKKWKKDPDFRKEYESLQPEFKLARVLIEARAKSGLSQREVAELMGDEPAYRGSSGKWPQAIPENLGTLRRGCRYEDRDTPCRWLIPGGCPQGVS